MITVSMAIDDAVIRATLASTSASFIREAVEAEQQTIDQARICFTPRHLAGPLLVAPRLFCTWPVEQGGNGDGKEIMKETDG
jgi:hypothetical protein